MTYWSDGRVWDKTRERVRGYNGEMGGRKEGGGELKE